MVLPTTRKQTKVGGLVLVNSCGGLGDLVILLSRALHAREKGLLGIKSITLFTPRKTKPYMRALYANQHIKTHYYPFGFMKWLVDQTEKNSSFSNQNPLFFYCNFVGREMQGSFFRFVERALGINDGSYYRLNIADNIKRHIKRPFVLLNLFSVSGTTITIDAVEPTLRALLNQGYLIIENTRDKAHFASAETVYPGIDDLFILAKEASLIISVRSGVLDVLAQTDTPIVCLLNRHDSWQSHFSLSGWRTNNILELYVDAMSEDVVMEFLAKCSCRSTDRVASSKR